MFVLNGLSSPEEQTTEQDCDALISLPVFLPCASGISGEKDSGASAFQRKPVGKTPVSQQRSTISEAHLQLAPVGNTFSCFIAESSVKIFARTMLGSCSDHRLANPGSFLYTKPRCHKNRAIHHLSSCLFVLCWLKLRFSSTLLHDARLTGLIYPVISFAFFRNSGKTLAFL